MTRNPHCIFLVAALWTAGYIHAQEPSPIIRGIVSDSLTHASLDGATISLFRNPGSHNTQNTRSGRTGFVFRPISAKPMRGMGTGGATDPSSPVSAYSAGGTATIHFITQLALEGDFARISYFAVDSNDRNQGIGRQMEAYCEQLARNRRCDRIEVHWHERRIDATRFYQQQGHTDSPKYLIKTLQ